jgi:hypothetical protein
MACGKGCNDWLDELSSQLADMNDCSCFYHTMWIHKNRVLENDVYLQTLHLVTGTANGANFFEF